MKVALSHVIIFFVLCVSLATSGIFNSVQVDLTYDHYAERTVDYLPAFLAMPFNSLVNLGYIAMGIYWLLQRVGDREDKNAAYVKDVFAVMAIMYAPVQWVRLTSLSRLPAVLDQWFTLPIFAWVPVWCRFVTHGWRPRYALAVELGSLLSYGLALVQHRGFEVALGCHVAFAVTEGVRVQRRFGDALSRRYLALAVLSCCGFVALKLLDHPMAQYRPFQYLTGHFWSKVCDVYQFHYSFRFLTHLTSLAQRRKE
ncbi:transmembrane protein 187 [Conger conger]|uniref:transmembrane protein 187 n=1 Tax=Conger conger TaxID=82655 RepID=UPI002A59BF1D|nr:transmembrane protein 187 [Conger conger]